jgi:hypothetical protein
MENEESIQPVESPEHGQAELVQSLGDDGFVAMLENAAKNVTKVETAMRKIIVACTYPTDWVKFPSNTGDVASLSSAGAERLIKHMGVTYANWDAQKLTFDDEAGKGYRWIYTCDVIMGGKQIKAQGSYGTRDKFLGFKDGEWRDTSEINENHIQQAAQRMCRAEGVRALLGIRKMPWEQLEKIMSGLGQNAASSGKVSYNQGGEGGVSEQDRELRQKCMNMLKEMHADNLEEMKAAVKEYSSFKGNDGQIKSTDSLQKLKGKWLGKVYGLIKGDYEEWQKITDPEMPMYGMDEVPEVNDEIQG